MCEACYVNYGRPRVFGPLVTELVASIRELEPFENEFGNLHTVLADWNLSDFDIRWCMDHWKPHHELAWDEAERNCLRLLTQTTLEQRATALALYEGYTCEVSSD